MHQYKLYCHSRSPVLKADINKHRYRYKQTYRYRLYNLIILSIKISKPQCCNANSQAGKECCQRKNRVHFIADGGHHYSCECTWCKHKRGRGGDPNAGSRLRAAIYCLPLRMLAFQLAWVLRVIFFNHEIVLCIITCAFQYNRVRKQLEN